MRSIGMVLLVGLITATGSLYAEGVPPSVVEAVSQIIPGAKPDSIEPSPIPDLYEVVFGPNVIYVTGDGRHMFRGDLVDVRSKINLTEVKRNAARIAAIERLGEDSMIIFAPEKTEHTLTVFTDVDCGYCAKLHSQMAELNDYGIKVRYLAFPRAGIPSENYDRMVSVWCADDVQEAMTRAKLHRQVTTKKCANPVRDHFNMGQLVRVNGTPTLILEDGQIYPGYLPPDRLIQLLLASAG